MFKSILISIVLSFLAATFVAAQDAFIAFEGTQKTYHVNDHAGSSYNWAVNVQINPMVAANASATSFITTNGKSMVAIQWNLAGEYYLLVTENDAKGCTNTKAMRITVLPNNLKVSFATLTSSACNLTNNDFSVPVQFKDGNGQQLDAAHFPIAVSFAVNGVSQPSQIITFANQTISISGSSFTAGPNSEAQVSVTITGATDVNNLNVQPETSSGQNIHTRTIFRKLTAPTVVAQTTNNVTPVITGTATVGVNEIFSVSVNNFIYKPGDGNLILSGTNWTLTIPAARALPEGIYDVLAQVTNAQCYLGDASINELTIDTTKPTPLPTVLSQTTDSTTPLISGTATLASGEKLTVTVNGITYRPGDGNLSISGSGWSLQIPLINKLSVGVYQVIAKVTDAAGNSSVNATSNELTIKSPVAVIERLATNDVNITFVNVPVSGNVLINDAGFYGYNSTVKIDLDPVNGTVALAPDGSYTYTPKKDFTGVDNFYYTVCTTDDPAGCKTVNVTIQVLKDVLALIGPVANDDEAQTTVNTAVSGNMLSNDLFPSGDVLVLNPKLKQDPAHGSVVLNAGGRFTYTPASGFSGQDYFIYEICGNVSGLCASARVTITVANDPAVRLFAADDFYFSYAKSVQGNLLANDLYPSVSTLKVNSSPVVQSIHGTAVISADGTFIYTPTAGFSGTDQFVYEICDTQLGACARATVYILTKETPAQYADLSVAKTGPVSVVPGNVVNYQITVTNLGTAVAENVQINDYMPSAIGNAQFNLQGSSVSNSWSGFYTLSKLEVNKPFVLIIKGTVAGNAPDTLKNIATVTSSTWDPSYANNQSGVKTLVNRGPVARIQRAPSIFAGSCNSRGVTLDGSKSIGEGLRFSWSPSLYLDDAGSSKPKFIPGKSTRYTLTVTDSKGLKDTASVMVSVIAAPKAVTDKNVFVDKPSSTILLNGANSTGAGLTYLWLTKEGILLSGETKQSATVSGLGMYYLQVTDSLGCFSRDSVNVGLYIQAINDTARTNVNQSVIINVLKNDIPKKGVNPSSISIVSLPLHGVAEVSADSLILYMPEESYIGHDEFVYQVCDYFKKCDQAKVLVLINDVPFFIPEAFSPNGDGINDLFEIKGLARYKTVEIEIFNRYGNIVYLSKNYGEGKGKTGFWDGTAQKGLRIGSGPVPTGTYYYILTLNGTEKISRAIYLDR